MFAFLKLGRALHIHVLLLLVYVLKDSVLSATSLGEEPSQAGMV